METTDTCDDRDEAAVGLRLFGMQTRNRGEVDIPPPGLGAHPILERKGCAAAEHFRNEIRLQWAGIDHEWFKLNCCVTQPGIRAE